MILEPLISVIVPVYKVETYLGPCIDSILTQTYKNLEIILVDDGSPDRCGVICDEYAALDTRIKTIHKPNGGLSDARNAGMAVSYGEYLCFVDSDDLLPADSIEYLYQLLTAHDAQLAIGGRERFNDEDGRILNTEFHGSENIRVMDKIEAMRAMFRFGCASWARLYKRNIHIDVLFPVGEINEDEAIVLDVLENCEHVVQSDHIVYRYRCREESITTSFFSTKKLSWQSHCADNLAFIQQHHPELIPEAAMRYRSSLLWSLTEMALSDHDFSQEIRSLLIQLRTNKHLFRNLPFSYPQDRIRTFFLLYMPFTVYKTLIKKKRSMK